MYRRPETVIMVAFATGSVTVETNYQPAEVRAIFSAPDYESKVQKNPIDPMDVPTIIQEATIITLRSITQTNVKQDPRSDVTQYVLKNEEVSFRKKDVVFWSISEATDPPKIETLPGAGLIGGRR